MSFSLPISFSSLPLHFLFFPPAPLLSWSCSLFSDLPYPLTSLPPPAPICPPDHLVSNLYFVFSLLSLLWDWWGTQVYFSLMLFFFNKVWHSLICLAENHHKLAHSILIGAFHFFMPSRCRRGTIPYIGFLVWFQLMHIHISYLISSALGLLCVIRGALSIVKISIKTMPLVFSLALVFFWNTSFQLFVELLIRFFFYI